MFLETFEGPLDLLLYLIRKQNFNVLDIPMADVTVQYLGYVDQLRQTNLELASEYLLMAAMLIEIKSRMLLPVKKADSGEEAEDPRAELVRRLLEYEQMKLAAQRIDQLPQLGRDFLRAEVYIEQSITPRFPDVNSEDLRAAWADVIKRAKLVQHHKISREELSVREHMSSILRQLQNARFIEFSDLFDTTQGRAGRGGEFHRRARTVPRVARRDHPGRAVRADLCAPRLSAGLKPAPRHPARGAAARAAPGCLVSVRRVHKSTTIPRSKPVIASETAARAIP